MHFSLATVDDNPPLLGYGRRTAGRASSQHLDHCFDAAPFPVA